MEAYVHGYSNREAERLTAQADTLAQLLHRGTRFPGGSQVLECGCGTGAQTVHLATRNPQAHIRSIDICTDSLTKAREKIKRRQIHNVTFQEGDIYHPPFEPERFDCAFICFVLEHLADPQMALSCLRRVLKPGARLTVIEGDHGSWYCHPETELARRTVACLVEVQARMGGDAKIGRRLYPLLAAAGFKTVRVVPKMVYVDGSRPDLVTGFSKETFIAMVQAVEKQTLEMGLMDRGSWQQGIQDLYRATEADGTFCYTFFKATAEK